MFSAKQEPGRSICPRTDHHWTADGAYYAYEDFCKTKGITAIPRASIFSFYKINLTKIQSLPIIGREWEYLFYVDVIFNDYLRYKQSIDAVSPLTKELKILGEYAEGTSTI